MTAGDLPFPDRDVFAVWADHLLSEHQRARTAHAASLVAPEPWIVLECAWATRQQWDRLGLHGWQMLMERHPPHLARGQKADLFFLPASATDLERGDKEGVFFEFKVALAESPRTLEESIHGVAKDVETRKQLGRVYSCVLAFRFEWPTEPPRLFRWSRRRDRIPWSSARDYLKGELAAQQLVFVADREARVGPSPDIGGSGTYLWLGLYQHTRVGIDA